MVLHIFAYKFLNIQPISIWKKFWKAIYVRGAKGYFDLQHLQHASTYIAFVEKLWVSAFQNFFRIENWLNIKTE